MRSRADGERRPMASRAVRTPEEVHVQPRELAAHLCVLMRRVVCRAAESQATERVFGRADEACARRRAGPAALTDRLDDDPWPLCVGGPEAAALRPSSGH